MRESPPGNMLPGAGLSDICAGAMTEHTADTVKETARV